VPFKKTEGLAASVAHIAGENNYFTEMCSGSEAGSYLKLIDFVYHSTLGLQVIKKKEEEDGLRTAPESGSHAPLEKRIFQVRHLKYA